MNPEITLEFWARLFGRLALEMALVALLAVWWQRLIKPVRWRRMIWQTALLSMVLLLIGELTGVNGVVAGWSRLRTTPAPINSPPSDLKTQAVVSVKMLSAGSTQMSDAPELGTPSPGPAKSVAAVWWPAGIWLLGMMGAMSAVLAPRFLFWWLRGRRVQAVTDERLIQCVGTLARRMGIRRPVRMIKRQSLAGPVAFGWWQPTVGLPDSIDSHFTAPQQEVMMAHELAHLAAHDPAWHFLADLVCALLWWHPLAWWCRGRLLSASELAADEASRLLPNGPGTLAECLVVMGRQLSQPIGVGWQRIEGNGFRSSLGQRVERLLAMPERSWQPWGRTRQWLGILGGLLTLVVLVVSGVAWLAPSSLAGDVTTPKNLRQTWRSSLAALALTAAISPANSTPVVTSNSSGGLTTPGDKTEDNLFAKLYSVDEETLMQRMQKAAGASRATKELQDQAFLELIRKHLAQVVGLETAPKTLSLKPNSGLLMICARAVDFVAIDRAMESLNDSWAGTVGRGWSPNGGNAGTAVKDNQPSATTGNSSQQTLTTRVFKVDPNVFFQGHTPEIIGLHPVDKLPTTNNFSGFNMVFLQALKFFEGMGVKVYQYGSGITNAVTWDGLPDHATPALTMYYNVRAGRLLVHGTPAELNLIETGIQFLNSSPAQVNIAVKFVELSEEQARALTGIIHPLPQADQAGAASPLLASANRPPIRGIITDRQFREFTRSMETNIGVNVISAPLLTTLSGRQAQIQVDATRTATIPTGPCLDVIPRALPDGSSIRMNLRASVTDFLGYEPIATTTAPAIDPAWPESRPQFRLQQASGTVTVWDGQTVVLEGAPEIVTLRGKAAARNGLTNETRPAFMTSPLAAYQSQSKPDPDYQKRLLVFVTPTLIDTAGNRVHADDNLPFDPKSIPPQTGTR